MSPLPRPCLCLVTDRCAVTPGARTIRDELNGLDAQLDAACDAGVDMIQVRERDLEGSTLTTFVRRLVARAPAGTRVLVNDRADVAVATGAAGVHLRSDGPSASRVRVIAPGPWLIGRSIHTPAEAAQSGEADYLIFGTVFPSRSKPIGSPVSGIESLRDACALSPVPVIAIGGISADKADGCRVAGAAGLAAIELFLPHGRTPGALGAAEAVKALRGAWGGMLQLPRLA